MARLMAYKLVAKTGATTMKPDKEPTNNQKRSWAIQVMNAPMTAKISPCSMLSQGARTKSLNPNPSHCMGWFLPSGKMGGKKCSGFV
jgi:hypothetical protein